MKVFNASVFESFPVLSTSRLTMRDIRPQDAHAIFNMRSNGRINRFISRDAMTDQADAAQLVQKTIDAYKNRAGIGWAGVLRDRGGIIGTCGFNDIDMPNLRAEIGGELGVDYWGKNIALEAVRAIVDFGFDIMRLHSIEAKVSPDNRGAIYLLRELGFEKEAHYRDRIYFRGSFHDLAVFTLVDHS